MIHNSPGARLRLPRFSRAAIASSLAILGLVAAGCGSSADTGETSAESQTLGSGESAAPDAEGQNGSEAPADTDAATLDLAALQAGLDKARAEPGFLPPGPAFDAKPAAGKTIFSMVSDSTNPFYNSVTDGERAAAEAAGLEYISYTNQGSAQQWKEGMQHAISSGVDVIILGAIDPKLIGPQIDEANAKGIHVIESGQYWPEAEIPDEIAANVFQLFTDAARLMVDYAVVESDGELNALIITDNEYPSSAAEEEAIIERIEELCPSTCKHTSADVVITNWEQIQSEVESALVRDPSINWILPVYDPMIHYVVPALLAKDATDKVSVISYNGTVDVLSYISNPESSGGSVKADIGENALVIGWTAIDQSLRLLVGEPPAKDAYAQLRLFDESNIDLVGNPPEVGKGYGEDVSLDDYLELWGLK